MALYTTSLTSNTSVFVAHVHRRRDANYWVGTILAYGSFSSGTITWSLSPDGGTTKIPLKDLSGTTITTTANDNFNVTLGNPSANSQTLSIYATLAGAGTPSITINLYDNL